MREPLEPGSPPPMPMNDVIVSESESEEVEVELIVRQNVKQKGDDKTMAPPITSIEKDDVKQRRHVHSASKQAPVKTSGDRSHPPDSLATMGRSFDGGYDSDDHSHRSGRPKVVRKLTYRYVPDTERMSLRDSKPVKTEIIIEEMRPSSHHHRTLSEDTELTVPPPSKGVRQGTVELIASRPGAWSHGKMIQVEEHLDDDHQSMPSSVSEVERAVSPSDKAEALPEWYYRRVTRTTAPFPPSSRAYGPPTSASSNARRQIELDRQSRPPRSTRDKVQEEAVFEYEEERPVRRPLQSILQGRAQPAIKSRAAFLEEEQIEPDYEPERQSKVAFAVGTKRGGKSTGVACTPLPRKARDAVERPKEALPRYAREAVERREEALDDYEEAQSDKEQERRVKSHVRHEARKDGGAFMTLDGHYSESDG